MNERLVRAQPIHGGHSSVRTNGARNAQAAVVDAFLTDTLASGAISVPELEERARTAGLLGEHNHIGDAKRFKSAKKRLGIVSRRDGFGRGGEWLWQLPAPPTPPMLEVLSSPASIAPVSDVYVGGLSPGDILASTEALCADAEVATDASTRRVPFDWAEGVELLQARPRPLGIPAHRWRIFIEDCRRFLASPLAERAAELGWDASSLFGSRFQPPHEHLGQAGLIWNLSGGAIVKIYKDGAAIMDPDGRRRNFHRRPNHLTTGLPWRL
jgi:hypothetical protein